MESGNYNFLLSIFPVEREKIAYFAGLFDGEGYLNFNDYPNYRLKRSYSKSDYAGKRRSLTSWMIGIQMATPAPLYELQKAFGGNIHSYKRHPQQRRMFEWKLYGLNAKHFLELLHPYLLVKKEQAEVALKLFQFYRVQYSVTKPERVKLQETLRKLKHEEFFDETGVRVSRV